MDKITQEFDLLNSGDQRVNKRAKKFLEKLYTGVGI